MSKAPKPPVSHTVTTVFETFIAELKTTGVDATVVKGFKDALLAQDFDADSLRKAMFGSVSKPQ